MNCSQIENEGTHDIDYFMKKRGRICFRDRGDDEVAMYQQMCQEKPDMTVVTDIAKRNQVVFLCFNHTEQEIPDDVKPYGYHILLKLRFLYSFMAGNRWSRSENGYGKMIGRAWGSLRIMDTLRSMCW